MPILAKVFFIYIGFFIGTLFGIFLAYVLKQRHNEERISAEDVEKWMENQELFDNQL